MNKACPKPWTWRQGILYDAHNRGLVREDGTFLVAGFNRRPATSGPGSRIIDARDRFTRRPKPDDDGS
ncbi:hypothetical protein ACFL2M_00380 [Patescibacteria group bacterium]